MSGGGRDARDLARLTALLPPPARPSEAIGHDWSAFGAAHGLRTPRDWRAFLSLYGTGAIGGFLWVLNPFSANPALNAEAIAPLRGAYAVMKERFPEDHPRDPAAFLPFGLTDNGDSLAWLMEGDDPDAWTIAVFDGSQAEEAVETTGLTLLPFLLALLEGRLRSAILPPDFLSGPFAFTPGG